MDNYAEKVFMTLQDTRLGQQPMTRDQLQWFQDSGITRDEYQAAAWSFMVLPGADVATHRGSNTLHYSTDGLVGEIGELVAACVTGSKGEDPEGIYSEMGDVFWYLVVTLKVLGRSFDGFTDHLVDPDHNALLRELLVEACLLKNVTKKIRRDADGLITNEVKERILWHLRYIYVALIALCYQLEVDPERVWIGNLEKLVDRAERGVIKGSGDKR